MNARVSDPSVARVARMTQNEALFREVNEQITALNELGARMESFTVVCECGNERCAEVVDVHRSHYESVRAQSDRFIVASGHVIPEIETVVEQHGDFVVVDKNAGIPEAIAAATDPRA